MTTKPYQDRFIRGQTVSGGYRECASRYALIRPVVEPFGRDAWVLDFGANTGYFGFRLAHELKVRVLAIDSEAVLGETAEANGNPRVEVTVARLTPAAVAALPQFDVVLALSVLHHNLDWRALLAALWGRTRGALLVETPHPKEPLKSAAARGDLALIHDVLSALPGTLLGDAKGVWSAHRRPIYRIAPLGRLEGTVFTGGGRCSGYWTDDVLKRLTGPLGYQPHRGSLNLQMSLPIAAPARLFLGPPDVNFWDGVRARHGHGGGDYQFWRVRMGHGTDVLDAHAMIPGARVGPTVIELAAPYHLRTHWQLKDGDRAWIERRPEGGER